jgi:hypothetical protein
MLLVTARHADVLYKLTWSTLLSVIQTRPPRMIMYDHTCNKYAMIWLVCHAEKQKRG